MSARLVVLSHAELVGCLSATPTEIHAVSGGEVLTDRIYRGPRFNQKGPCSEKIFGPLDDCRCVCGRYRNPSSAHLSPILDAIFGELGHGERCGECGVVAGEGPGSKWRRVGHIDLAMPVVHPWLRFGGRYWLADLVSLALGGKVIRRQDCEAVVTGKALLVTAVDREGLDLALAGQQESIDEYLSEVAERGRRAGYVAEEGERKPTLREVARIRAGVLKAVEVARSLRVGDVIPMTPGKAWPYELRVWFGDYFTAGYGGAAIKALLETVDHSGGVCGLDRFLDSSPDAERVSEAEMGRASRLRRLAGALACGADGGCAWQPEKWVPSVVVVVPPVLRVRWNRDGCGLVRTPIEFHYSRLVNRNNQLRRLIETGAPELILSNEAALVQRSVDQLILNGRTSEPSCGPDGRPLGALSEVFTVPAVYARSPERWAALWRDGVLSERLTQ